MAQETINVGTIPNDGTGDTVRDSFVKVNDNFTELYTGSGTVDKTQYNTALANPAHSEGLVFYDNGKKALSYYNNDPDVTVNLGQELLVQIYNDTGVTITNGQLVRIASAFGGLPTVTLALGDTVENSSVLGIATENILDATLGFVTIVGSVGGLDTSTFIAGDKLYLSSTVAGAFTKAEQALNTIIGTVIFVDALDGKILFRSRPTLNPIGIGQAIGVASTFDSTTTPTILAAFNNTDTYEKNVTVTQALVAGDYTATMNPTSIGLTGIYQISFSANITTVTNTNITFAVYKNGVTTGFKTIIDLNNAQMDTGTGSFTGILNTVITNTDTITIYCSSLASATLTFNSVSFTLTRIGND